MSELTSEREQEVLEGDVRHALTFVLVESSFRQRRTLILRGADYRGLFASLSSTAVVNIFNNHIGELKKLLQEKGLITE